MYQPNSNQPLFNGLPSQVGSSVKQDVSSSFNGIGSTNTSRGSSPGLSQIPPSQLPPRTSIPLSQLPPSHTENSNITNLAQNYNRLTVSGINGQHTTPNASPKAPFSTSTPVATGNEELKNGRNLTSETHNFNPSSAFSPISTPSAKIANIDNDNNFKNVPLDSNSENSSTVPNPVFTGIADGSKSHNFPRKPSSTVQSSYNPVNFTFTSSLNQKQATIDTMTVKSSALPSKPVPLQPFLNQVPNPNIQQFSSEQFQPQVRNVTHSQAVPFQPTGASTAPPLTIPTNAAQKLGQTYPGMLQTVSYPANATQVTSIAPPMQPRSQQIRPNRYPVQKMPDVYNSSGFNNPPPPCTNSNFTSQNQPPHPTAFNPQSQAPRLNTASQYQSPENIQPNPNTLPLQSGYSNQNAPQQQRVPSNQFYPGISVNQGINRLWGHENIDLLQSPNILPANKIEAPKISLGQNFLDETNCSTDIFRCTLTKIPDSKSLLQKSRLPFGILIHPFKDLEHLPVIQCSTIVRCRSCRTYINPFVFFVDVKRWKCNLCYRLNELPEEFQYDPVSKTYGNPSIRPEIKASTIEYIAPSEYMLRPPQPAVYLFLFDVSKGAIDSGYLPTFCKILAENLSNLPGDGRTQIGFIAYNSALHFYSLAEGLNQPHEMTVVDIDDVFLPCPDNLLINLNERKDLIMDLLSQLPNRFKNNYDTSSALGAALQAAHKMIGAIGGRVTVFQSVLPNKGPGALLPREDPNQRSAVDVQHLNPVNDFYKRLALECSGQQIAVDLFIVNCQYVDLATISGISRFSGGCIYHFPLFNASRTVDKEKLERCLKRYLTRKIGFEAVLRVRCTRGLTIHTFHGNFFVRSTDLLSLPNVNPDAGFGMQIAIEDSLSDLRTVCFQAALLYTSSKGERRIRVHTLCIPVSSTLTEIVNSADQQCMVGILSKMAVDRSLQSSLADAREAFLNVAIDVLSGYKLSLNMDNNPSGLLAPDCLKLLPLYISALLKYIAFRTGTATRLDDRIKAMCDLKTLPLYLLIQQVYPDLYPVHNLEEHEVTKNLEGEEVPQPPHLQITARNLDNTGAYLLDQGDNMILYLCSSISVDFLASIFGVSDYNAVPEDIFELPLFDNLRSQRLNMFINYLNDEKPFPAVLQVMKDNSPNRQLFIERLLEDRVENSLSYHEFLQHLKTQVK